MRTIYFLGWLSVFLMPDLDLQAQEPIRIEDMLKGKKAYHDVLETIERYYSKLDIVSKGPARSEYKRWKRWAWFAGSHLDEKGIPVNLSEKTWDDYQPLFREDISRKVTSGQRVSNTGAWQPLGPYFVQTGLARVDRLAFHPTDANTIFAGTPAGGMFKTLDGGANWFPLNGYLPNVGVSGLVVDVDNGNHIYALTGDGDSNINGFVESFGYIRQGIGVLKSTDGGNTWNMISRVVPAGETYYGFKLIQLSNLHNRFFACTTRGLFRSDNYGITWTRDPVIGTQVVYDVEDAGNGNVYASTGNRVFLSNDSGVTFAMVNVNAFSQPPNAFTQRTSIMISPAIPNSLYVHFGGNSSAGTETLLYRSDNNGNNFVLVTNSAPTTQAYMAGMTALRNDFNTVLIGEVILSRSVNGGSNFTQVGNAVVHADVHEIACHPLNNNVYVACDGGIYRSTDNGATWSDLYFGIQASQFYHMTGVNAENEFMLGGTQDNGIIQTINTGGTYTNEQVGDGFEADYLNNNDNRYYYSVNTSVFDGQREPYAGINKTPPGATSWYPSVAIHPEDDDIIYAGYAEGVFRTDNNGLSWVNTGAKGGANGQPAGGLAVSDDFDERVYAADDVTIWVSDNQGDNWNVISTNPGFPAITSTTPITDIATSDANADRIAVTHGGYSAGNKVFYSINYGSTWSNISGSLPDVPILFVKHTTDGDLYIGTDIGVFFKDAAMSDWVPFSNGLPLVPVTDLFINEANGTIKAGTFGRGIWQGDLYTDCGPFLLLGDIIWGRNFFQSNGFIETQQIVPGSIGNELRLRSPVRITLKNNFKVERGGYLHAVIGNCGQGVIPLSTPETIKATSSMDNHYPPRIAADGN
jgi:photosystem II stability/assembly factor-like uncharacterized protein